jgi:pyridoxamine 5'-phosphate oxidase
MKPAFASRLQVAAEREKVVNIDRLSPASPPTGTFMITPAPFYDDLDASLAQAWAKLARGVADRRSRFRTPALATIGLDGAPQVRTVVLRGCDAAARTLRFQSDRRSSKFSELKRMPATALHFYDPEEKLQLRVAGRADVYTDEDIARAAWASSQVMSRAGYTQGPAPGVPLDYPTAIPQLAGVPDGDMTGFDNFAVVVIIVQSIEWLYLGSQGHRRARFTWNEGRLRATWLAP